MRTSEFRKRREVDATSCHAPLGGDANLTVGEFIRTEFINLNDLVSLIKYATEYKK